jgi:para-aminobenzoate synthetase/4-amino-4-deoxychorismate lyase
VCLFLVPSVWNGVLTLPLQTDGIHLRFDFPDRTGLGRPLEFRDPIRVHEAHQHSEVLEVLRAVQEATDQGLYAAGYLAYEAAPAFDPAFERSDAQAPVIHAHRSPLTALPLAWFGLFTAPCDAGLEEANGDYAVLSDWRPTVDQGEYDGIIHSIRAAIERGETYQANYTFRLKTCYCGSETALYRRTLEGQPVAYAASLRLGRHWILSFSPELFFERDGETIVTKPMKGTRMRGRWSEEDRECAADLAASEKDRAENLMIVDLLRNDLGRLAKVGSVEVEDLFCLERYATVWQMTSKVRAQLPMQTSLAQIFTALFPCGSVTGAPKVRTIQLLAGWERTPRHIYCGAIGYAMPGNRSMFNVPIRTLLLDRLTGRAEYGVGGGITWDSTPQGEYAEALAKAVAVTSPRPEFSLLETLRLERGEYVLLERHLARLVDSADYFGIPVQGEAVMQALQAFAVRLDAGPWRVRLLLSQNGTIGLEHRPLASLADRPLRVALAATAIDRQDVFLFHKTTHRAVYEAHHREDVFDVLLWNEAEEVTEFTRGNLVVEHGGRYFTPPRKCGLLAGTLRAELLELEVIEERTIGKVDLIQADVLWFLNSVRGWVRVEIQPT